MHTSVNTAITIRFGLRNYNFIGLWGDVPPDRITLVPGQKPHSLSLHRHM